MLNSSIDLFDKNTARRGWCRITKSYQKKKDLSINNLVQVLLLDFSSASKRTALSNIIHAWVLFIRLLLFQYWFQKIFIYEKAKKNVKIILTKKSMHTLKCHY